MLIVHVKTGTGGRDLQVLAERVRYPRDAPTGEFIRLKKDDLDPSAVAASCLDDQFIDREALLSRGAEFRRGYTQRVLDEFTKCLVSARQVVVNRSYLQNTEVMIELASRRESGESEDLPIVQLINQGAIVPYLFADDDPTLEHTKNAGTVKQDAVTAWNKVCERTVPQCLRLEWDDKDDERARDSLLSAPFSRRLVIIAETASPTILQQLSYDCRPERIEAFGQYLRSTFLSAVRDLPTRRMLYDQLVTESGSDVSLTRVDLINKSFACEAKQIIDLVYNCNMASALELNSITPTGAITADLFADSGLKPAGGKTVTAEHAADLIARVLQMQQLAYHRETMPILGKLTMESVVKIRRNHVWQRYVDAVAQLQRIDTASDDRNFDTTLIECIGVAFERAGELSEYLHQHFSKARQNRTRVRSLIAQAGGICFGAALSTAVGMPFPATLLGTYTGNLAGGMVQTALDSPIRSLGLRLDPFSRAPFAAWRLPPMKLERSKDTMGQIQKDLEARRISIELMLPDEASTPTTETETAPL